MTAGLPEFLLARIAEDETAARTELRTDEDENESPGSDPWTGEFGEFFNRGMTFVCAWHPARVLAECQAKRELLTLADPYDFTDDGGTGMSEHADKIHRLLAVPYADHPDYREEWRP